MLLPLFIPSTDRLTGISPVRRIGCFQQGAAMFPFWMNLEITQLHEFLTTSFVAVASTVSWLCFAGRP